MDLEEWEYLSEDSRFIDQLHRQGRKGKRLIPIETLPLQPNNVIDTNYFQFHPFIHPDYPSEVPVSPNLIIPLQIPNPPDHHIEKTIPSPDSESPAIPFQAFGSEADQETVSSQVFFKKMKGNEFADMKLDSPKSGNRVFAPQIELGQPQFEEEYEESGVDSDKEVFGCDDGKQSGVNIWKMGMTGIGALFTFGVACATVCVIAIITRHKESKHRDHKLHLHVYTHESHDKGMKQVVEHAAKLNEAISAARERAHVTIGGYFDAI